MAVLFRSIKVNMSISTQMIEPLFPSMRGIPRTAASVAYRKKLESGSTREDKFEDSDNIPQLKQIGQGLITMPLRLQKRLEKKIIKDSTKYAQRQKIIAASRKGDDSRILIHARRKEYNHHVGQSYGKKETMPLASKGWAHRKSAGDYFTIKPQNQGDSVFGLCSDDSNFKELDLKPILIQQLLKNGIKQPTLIQILAIPEILKEENCLVAAETGCGKTLAYLLPLFQQIIDDKRSRIKRGLNHPFAIVLVPSRELAQQIFTVATTFAEGLDINIRVLQGGHIGAKIKSPPSAEVDLIIATPNVVSALTSFGVFENKSVQHVVLDEADSLLDDSFATDVIQFLSQYPFRGTIDRTTQITLVSATLPRSVESILGEVVPMDSLLRVTTPNIHRVLTHVPQKFLRLKKSEKPEKIIQLVQSATKDGVPIMIFCNKSDTCSWLSRYLMENGIDCVGVHSKLHSKYRKGLVELYQSGGVNVMVCTDLGSRGIDTVRTGHVVNYEFPNFLADYIHRCGRTGRVGSRANCNVTNFISRPNEVEIVNEIESSVRKEISLEKVNANIKRILNARYGMYQPIVADED